MAFYLRGFILRRLLSIRLKVSSYVALSSLRNVLGFEAVYRSGRFLRSGIDVALGKISVLIFAVLRRQIDPLDAFHASNCNTDCCRIPQS